MDEARTRRGYPWLLVGLLVVGVPAGAFLGYLVTLAILNLIFSLG